MKINLIRSGIYRYHFIYVIGIYWVINIIIMIINYNNVVICEEMPNNNEKKKWE